MATDPKLDTQLRNFLQSAETDKAEGNTIANLRLEVGQLHSNVEEIGREQGLMRLRLNRHGQDIREIKKHLEWSEGEVDTGTHQVEDLRKHLAEKEAELTRRRDSSIWWKRQWWKWGIAGIGALAFAALNIFLSILLSKR